MGKDRYYVSDKKIAIVTGWDLVDQALENGYIVDTGAGLPGKCLVARCLRLYGILPREIHKKAGYEQLMADMQKEKEMKLNAENIGYHLMFSTDYMDSFYLSLHTWLHSPMSVYSASEVEKDEFYDVYYNRQSYVIAGMSRRADLLHFMIRGTGLQWKEISWKEQDVFEMMSASAAFTEKTDRESDSSDLELGIWGLPGTGTKFCAQALKEMGAPHDFHELTEVTKKALSVMQKENERTDTTFTEAYMEAFFGYLLTFCFLHYPAEWDKAYKKAFQLCGSYNCISKSFERGCI